MNKNFTFSLPPEQMEEVAKLAKKNVRSISNQVQFMLSLAIEVLNEQNLEMVKFEMPPLVARNYETKVDDLDLGSMTESQMLNLTPEQRKAINDRYKKDIAKLINK